MREQVSWEDRRMRRMGGLSGCRGVRRKDRVKSESVRGEGEKVEK